MSRKYAKSPIKEVLCSFQFSPDSPWDMTMPGLIYEKIKSDFPERKQETVYDYGLSEEEGKLRHNLKSQKRVRFSDPDRKVSIIIGPRNISIRHEEPYDSWENFYPSIQAGLDTYKGVVGSGDLSSAALRYSNVISLPDERIDLKDYFNIYPYIGEGLPKEHGHFFLNLDFPYIEGRDRLRLKFGSFVIEDKQHPSLRLDLEYFLDEPKKIDGEILEWTNRAHDLIGEAFESAIKDKLRKHFEGGD